MAPEADGCGDADPARTDRLSFEFAPEAATLGLVVDMIDAERQRCRFLRFALTFEADAGPLRLEVTGPKGAQDFVEALLESG